MKKYLDLSPEEARAEYENVNQAWEQWKSKGLKLNMSRGKPGLEQLNLVTDIFSLLLKPEDFTDEGIETRNYGELAGLPSARRMFADILSCKPEQIFVAGNASLEIMYDTIAKAYTHGLLHSPKPWGKEDKVKWLCPVPGYDRHFKICETFGMEMISVPMTKDGPDLALIDQYIQDPTVKGMWNVPKYTNPDGYVYSEETIRHLAAMKPAAPDFLLAWDNAYCVHEFEGEFLPFPDILSLCASYGNPDMPIEYASTSKITFPGAGVSCLACSEANLAHLVKLVSFQTISFDKINQLRHVRFLKDKANTIQLMKQHSKILAPKFQSVFRTLDAELVPLGILNYHRPLGGYFVSVYTTPGLATRTLELCKECGVVMTNAGATYPYGIDPQDSNIRIAPTYPPLEELEAAMSIFALCLRKAALEKQMA